MVSKVIDLYHRLPNIKLGEAMKLAGFSDDDYHNIVLRRIIQRALPGGSVKAFRASIAVYSTPVPSRLMRYESRVGVDIAIVDGTSSSTTPALESTPPLSLFRHYSQCRRYRHHWHHRHHRRCHHRRRYHQLFCAREKGTQPTT